MQNSHLLFVDLQETVQLFLNLIRINEPKSRCKIIVKQPIDTAVSKLRNELLFDHEGACAALHLSKFTVAIARG